MEEEDLIMNTLVKHEILWSNHTDNKVILSCTYKHNGFNKTKRTLRHLYHEQNIKKKIC